MGLFDRLRAAFSPSYQIMITGNQTTVVGGMDTAQLYRTQPNLRAVVGFLADNAASVPWKVYDRVDDGDRVRVRDSAAALLLARPNEFMTPYEWRRAIFSDKYLYDMHLSLLVPDAEAKSGNSAYRVPPEWLDGYIGGNAWAPDSFIIRTPDGRRIEVPREACLWIHGYDPMDPMRQTSPVEALKDMLAEQIESAHFRRQMWTRGGRFNAYLTRPKDVAKWDNDSFERFKRSWNESWAGKDAADGGGMPILEDGMEIRQVQFNAKDAEWSEAKRLGREDVAGVYHVNPALIWPGSGQTYASAKENARALYNDTLAPTLMEVTDKINAWLLPAVGEPESHYVEYDLEVKLQGDFDERVRVMQASTGGPFMTRAEARGKFNLPFIEGTDELIVPMNVTVGGLASPRDTDPTVDRYNAALTEHKCDCGHDHKSVDEIRYKAEPTDEETQQFVDVFAKFFERQSRSVLPKIRAAKAAGAHVKDSDDWWDVTRWNNELADDLTVIAEGQSEVMARRALRGIGVPDDEYDPDRASEFLADMCRVRAEWVNETTRKELERALELEEAGAEGLKATPEGVFENAIDNRSVSAGSAIASAIDGWSAIEAARQAGAEAQKRWVVTSKNPRPSHAAMGGVTVGLDDRFPNGMQWPGDWDGGPDEVCGCQCQIELVTQI